MVKEVVFGDLESLTGEQDIEIQGSLTGSIVQKAGHPMVTTFSLSSGDDPSMGKTKVLVKWSAELDINQQEKFMHARLVEGQVVVEGRYKPTPNKSYFGVIEATAVTY